MPIASTPKSTATASDSWPRRWRPTAAPTDHILVATKGGHRRPGDGSWTVHGDPDYVKQACEASLIALGVEAIGLYQYHRPDPQVP